MLRWHVFFLSLHFEGFQAGKISRLVDTSSDSTWYWLLPNHIDSCKDEFCTVKLAYKFENTTLLNLVRAFSFKCRQEWFQSCFCSTFLPLVYYAIRFFSVTHSRLHLKRLSTSPCRCINLMLLHYYIISKWEKLMSKRKNIKTSLDKINSWISTFFSRRCS